MKENLRLYHVLGYLMLATNLVAQNFIDAPQATPFVGAYYFGATAFIDIDNDLDQDVIITGLDSMERGTTRLYINDGLGHFIAVEDQPFEDYFQGSISPADVDSDGDQDVLISGVYGGSVRLYMNDGNGHFTEKKGTPFGELSYSAIEFADIDGDGDLDLYYSGRRSTFEPITQLYANDGTGSFTLVPNTPFENLRRSAAAFADVDGDEDQDVLITGENQAGEKIAELYVNNGTGIFQQLMNMPFVGIQNGDIEFADVDNDNDQDVLIVGSGSALLYINDGTGHFTESGQNLLGTSSWGSIQFADVDGDEDQDVFIVGNGNSRLFINDGAGGFSLLENTIFEGALFGSVATGDVDGDQDLDVMMTGLIQDSIPVSKLYINDGPLSQLDKTPFAFDLNFTSYPNPTRSHELMIEYHAKDQGELIITIYDLKGRIMSRHNETAIKGQQVYPIDISLLGSGNYYVQLTHGLHQGSLQFSVH